MDQLFSFGSKSCSQFSDAWKRIGMFFLLEISLLFLLLACYFCYWKLFELWVWENSYIDNDYRLINVAIIFTFLYKLFCWMGLQTLLLWNLVTFNLRHTLLKRNPQDNLFSGMVCGYHFCRHLIGKGCILHFSVNGEVFESVTRRQWVCSMTFICIEIVETM